jgi:hypothetical protein
VLRKVFEPKREDVTAGWRKLHIEELRGLYFALNTIRMIKPRRTRCAEHVARMGRTEMRARFWRGNLKERDYLEDMGVDGRIILNTMGWRGLD